MNCSGHQKQNHKRSTIKLGPENLNLKAPAKICHIGLQADSQRLSRHTGVLGPRLACCFPAVGTQQSHRPCHDFGAARAAVTVIVLLFSSSLWGMRRRLMLMLGTNRYHTSVPCYAATHHLKCRHWLRSHGYRSHELLSIFLVGPKDFNRGHSITRRTLCQFCGWPCYHQCF